MVEGISRLDLSGPEERPDGLKSKRRLTSQFERIKNVKNFDVEIRKTQMK